MPQPSRREPSRAWAVLAAPRRRGERLTRRRALLVGGVAAGLAAACRPASPAGDSFQAQRRPTTVSLTNDWLSGRSKVRLDRVQGALARFAEENPSITVDAQATAGSTEQSGDQLLVQLVAGTASDVFLADSPKLAAYLDAGAAYFDISAFIKRDRSVDLNDYFPPRGEGWESGGKTFGFPFQQSSGTAYGFNVTRFREVGAPLPGEHRAKPGGIWDWNDFLDVLRKVTRDADGDGVSDFYGAYVRNTYTRWWGCFVESNGGKALDLDRRKTLLDRPEAVEAFTYIVDLFHRYRVALHEDTLKPFQERHGDVFGLGRISVSQSVNLAGAVSINEQGTTEWGMAHVPASPRTGKSVPMGAASAAHVVNAKAKDPEAAYVLVRFLGGPWVQAFVAETSAVDMPALKSVARGDAWMPKHPDLKRVVFEATERSSTLPWFRQYDAWWKAVHDAARRAYVGEASAKDAMLEATANGDIALRS